MKGKICLMWSIYGNSGYFRLLDLSIASAKLKSPEIDRVVICDIDCNYENEDCKIVRREFPQGRATRMAYRYEYAAELLKEYEYVLHVDADSLILKDVSKACEHKFSGLSVASENSTNPAHFKHLKELRDFAIGQYWAGPLLTSQEKEEYKSVPSICMGVWLASKSEAELLRELYREVQLQEVSGFHGDCYDQHAVVRKLLLSDRWNFSLQDHVSHLGGFVNTQNDLQDLNESTISVLHFAGGVQPTNEKFEKMKFVMNELKNEVLP